ncbi:hypothetical protein BDF21DRAFT_404601 [Thamnidium elegans]|nr:hypothetical protein BDF21DRAFT_404601 [Thamnidium elegans]
MHSSIQYSRFSYGMRTTRFFLEALSNKYSPFFFAKRKSLARHIYTLKLKQESIWPLSVEKKSHLEEIIQKLNALWSSYKTMNNKQKDLHSQPHQFFKWMFYLQKEVSKKVYLMEETPLSVASKSHVYRKLKELSLAMTLNIRSFKSLQEQVLESINAKILLILGKKLKQLEPHISVLSKFVESVQSRIQDKTFTSAKYTDRPFWRLVNQSGIEGYKKGAKNESDLYDFYFKLFDFSKIGFRKRKNCQRKKKVGPKEKLPADFQEDIENGCNIWGVDPGVNTIITSVDTHVRQRVTSLEGYYHLCGFNDASFVRRKHKNQHMAEHLKITSLSSLKTSNITNLVSLGRLSRNLYDDISFYYNENSWSSKLKFKCYMRKQKDVHEICKRLIHGSVKYNSAESTGVKTSTNNENTYSPPAPSDNLETPGKTIIAFGDGAFSGNLRGHKAAPVRLIKKALNKYCGNNLEICMVDEYLTSQICNECKNRNVENIVTHKSKRRVHTILKRQQTTCNIVWNRDIMTAYNILDIFLFAAKSNNQRLDAFKRQNTTSEQSSV